MRYKSVIYSKKWRWEAVVLALTLGFTLLLKVLPEKALSQSPLAAEAQEKDCFQIFARADDLYQAGGEYRQVARDLYAQCKPDFSNTSLNHRKIPDPVNDINELDGGHRLWKLALEGIEGNIDSKIFFNLTTLIKNYPQFIPAHLKLAEFCLEKPEFCEKSAKGQDPKNASEILTRVTELYPDNADLLRTKIYVLAQAEKFIEASIAARQFALIYPDYPEAPEFSKLADDYLNKFESEINQQLAGTTFVNTILSIANAVFLRNLTQAVSGVQMIGLLLQGESNFGQQVANAYANQYKEKGRLVEDLVVLDYIKDLGDRLTPLMGRNFTYEYYVVKDSDINAFALPGGKIFIHTGAILNSNSAAELTGLLGHEIAHAALSHGFRRLTQQALLINLNQILPLSDLFSIIYAQYSREDERQADILGARALATSGFAADGLLNFMVTLKKTSGSTPTTLLSSHPATDERISYLEKMIQDNGYNRYALEGVRTHKEIQERLQDFLKTENTPS